jgi:cytochrome oxidase Cu insertion factor (SCO1/SenC/PrrC family)
MIRTPESLIPYIVAMVAVLAGLLWHIGDSIPRLGHTSVFGAATIGGPFSLIDQNGKPASDRGFRGRWMFVYFGYTNCPDVCPITLSEMADVMDRLGPKAARMAPIFITVDPARDRPKTMKDYVASFGPRFTGLTGDARAIENAEHEYRVAAIKHPLPGGGYAMDHSGTMYLMDPNGKFAMDYDEGDGPKKIAADIKKRL